MTFPTLHTQAVTHIVFYLPTSRLISIPRPGAVCLRQHFLLFDKQKPAGEGSFSSLTGAWTRKIQPALKSKAKRGDSSHSSVPITQRLAGRAKASAGIAQYHGTKSHQKASALVPKRSNHPAESRNRHVPLASQRLASQNASSRAPTDRAPLLCRFPTSGNG